MRKSISFFLAGILFILPLQADSLAEARDRAAHGEYESAATYFEKHLQSAPPSAAAYFELGQVLQKSEKEAEAALAYRRSLVLDPGFAAAANALRESNARLGVTTPVQNWRSLLGEKIHADTAVLVGCIAFWVGAFLLLASLAFPKKRLLFLSLGLFLLVAGSASCLASALTDPRIFEARQSVVMNLAGASLYKVPSEDASEKITTLNQGSTLKILSARGRWLHVELPGGQRGWVLQDGVARVIPSA
ncbi:MAG: SH3 domain-containing protein [Spartobacteria bacterium]